MEVKVYESDYLSLLVNEQAQLLKVIWSHATELMQDEVFRKELTNYAEIAEKYQPTKSFVDTQYFFMAVAPETQEWINQNIHERSLHAGIKKFAYLVSTDLFSQVSIEQTMEEGNAKYIFETRYFDNEETAIEWLSLTP
ncbi:MAG: STAS/SEC14 domain-containing protein [Microscillaceae bacterium]|nr:STAS/SEC14 domain-containing protein [Microscillaceae bacterium]